MLSNCVVKLSEEESGGCAWSLSLKEKVTQSQSRPPAVTLHLSCHASLLIHLPGMVPWPHRFLGNRARARIKGAQGVEPPRTTLPEEVGSRTRSSSTSPTPLITVCETRDGAGVRII
jgi:hypothetical protein